MNITRGKQPKPFLMALYGLPGVGKTLLASQAKEPLILDLEGGSRTFDCARVEIDSLKTLAETLAELKAQAGEFKTVVIDGATVLNTLLEQRIFEKYPKDGGGKASAIGDYLWGAGYGYLMLSWVRTLAEFNSLRDSGYNVIVIAHAAILTHKEPGGAEFNRYMVNLPNSEKNSIANRFMANFETVLFMRAESVVDKEKQGRTVKVKATREPQQRIICTEGTAAWAAKTRVQGLASEYLVDIDSLNDFSFDLFN